MGGGVYGITGGCLNGDPQVTLGMHIYIESKARWETIAPGVPQYEKDPPRTTTTSPFVGRWMP